MRIIVRQTSRRCSEGKAAVAFTIVAAMVLGACAAPQPAGVGSGRGGVALPSTPPRGDASAQAEKSADSPSRASPAAASTDGGDATQRRWHVTQSCRERRGNRRRKIEGVAAEQSEAPEGPTIDVKPALPRFERFELVVEATSIADDTGNRPGNSWGGHQTRVLRLEDGDVYTAYLTTGLTFDAAQWHLVRRSEGRWRLVASGPAGREPVNILRTPNAGVAVVAWPNASPLLTTFQSENGSIARRDTPIPGQWETYAWPYNAAGIGLDGTLCALQSKSSLEPGMFSWACRSASDGNWEFHQTSLPHRYCYAFVLPEGRQLTLVAVRDVLWSTLGYTKPAGEHDYAFNASRAFSTADYRTTPLVSTLIREEAPTAAYPGPGPWTSMRTRTPKAACT